MSHRENHPSEPAAAADWLLIAVPGLIWGASFLFIAEGLQAMGPMGVTVVRIAVGFAALAFFRPAWRPIERADWGKVAWLGVLWMAFPLSMFPFAEQRISSALAGMLNGAVPLSAAVIASVLARRLPSRRIAIGLAVGLVGAVLMALPTIAEPSTAAGVLMVVAAVVSYGFAPNIARPLQLKYGALPVIWRAQVVALLLTLPFGFRDVVQAQWSVVPVLSLLALGALGTGVAHVVMTMASGRLGATRASATAFLIPPVALVLGVVLRGEHVALLSVLGGTVCIAGAWVMRRASAEPSGKRKAVTPARAAAWISLLLVAVPAKAQQLAAPALQHPVDRQAAWPLPRLTGPIRVDGRSDDDAWRPIAPLPLTVYLPAYGSTPAEKTEARIGYDENALYVVVDAWENHPGGIRASSMIRDDDAAGDFVNVVLDTFGDRQNAVSFSTTPGGQRNDWSISNDAQSDASLSPAWNGVWEVATRRDQQGWHAEYRIPFSTLRFTTRDGRVEFGLSLNRLTAHLNERVTFPAIEPTNGLALWKPSNMQRVSVEGIKAARSLRVTPYAVAGLEGSRTPDPVRSPWVEDDRFEVGGDLKMAVSPNMTLDLTANTDFAEAEVDDQRVNLTRFTLLFPERRPFFVERAGTFEVKTGETDLLFQSRRIGLTPDGETVRLLAGARVVGRAAGWDIGIFDAQMGRGPGGDRDNLAVLRLRHAAFNPGSWLGVMATSRLAPDSSQVALGADGELHLGGDDYASFAAAVLAGEPGPGLDQGVLPRGALRLRVERRRNRSFWYRAAVATTGARYTPALGYVERADAMRPFAEIGYGRVVTSAGHVVRASLNTALVYRNAAATFDAATTTAGLALELPTGGVARLTATRQDDDLVQTFEPTPATSVPPGRYRANSLQLAYTPPNGPRAVVGASARGGDYYDGSLYSAVLTPEWRASAHLRVSADLELDRLDFPARDQREWTKLARLRVFASASPRLSLIAVLQANSVGRVGTANLRLRYNMAEGHDLWIVYGQQENLDRQSSTPPAPGTARTSVLVKYTRSFGT